MRLEKQVPGLDCPLDHEYSEEEWRAFVQCAREGMESGERLHNEFSAKLEEKGLKEGEVQRALRSGAWLTIYRKSTASRLGLWDPRSDLMVVGTIPDGLILTAFRLPLHRAAAYLERQADQGWLRR
jgi:hypothetical protein